MLIRGHRAAPPVVDWVQPAALAIFVLVDVMAHFTVYDRLGVALTISLLLEPVILLLALGLSALFLRWNPTGAMTPRALPGIVGLSLFAAVVTVAVGQAWRGYLALEFDPRSGSRGLLIALIYYFMVFVIWSVICFWTRAETARRIERERAIQAEALAMRAEVERLRAQINPHFLFNAMNGIGEEIPENPAAALAMLRDLAVFLRQSLAEAAFPIVTVAVEAEALSAYLRVQQARFGPRLKPLLDVAPEALPRPLPSLLIQPLVENAIKHGRAGPERVISVTIGAEPDGLRVEVSNTGVLPRAPAGHGGIGLANIRSRLELHYPGRYRFDLAEENGMVVARLRLEGEPDCVS